MLKVLNTKKEKFVTVYTVMNVNQTYCSDHLTIYTNMKSLCSTPETNILYANYTSILKCEKERTTLRTSVKGSPLGINRVMKSSKGS